MLIRKQEKLASVVFILHANLQLPGKMVLDKNYHWVKIELHAIDLSILSLQSPTNFCNQC